MKKSVAIFFIISTLSIDSFAQIPSFSKDSTKRFRFAQTTIGGDLRITPAGGTSSFINSSGATESYDLGSAAWGRFVISGWHFWGHADFYIGLPLMKLSEKEFGTDGNAFYMNGVETGVKLYPSKIQEGKLRPFIGMSFNNTVFWQEHDKVKNLNLSRNTLPVQAGLTYVKNKSIFDLGVTYNHQTDFDYYISKTQTSSVSLPKVNLSLGWRTYFDMSEKDEPALLDGSLDSLGRKIKSDKKASAFSIAAGLSSPFYIKNKYNSENFPYIGDFRFSNSFIDYGLGFYWHKPDVHFNVAYRNYKNKLDAFDVQQEYKRNSVGLEVYKFLFDYHGFVPFLGPIVSYDQNSMKVSENGADLVNHTQSDVRYGFVFGWDIRQDDIQWLMLRTNLRYYPSYQLNIENKDYNFNQLEFNIIQAVFYPSRFKWVKNNKK
jgi:hypothetical protein